MKDIRAVALDVDGVLTDGGVWWGPDGQEWKRFSYPDIMGVSLGTKAGLLFALISGEDSPLVDRFAAKMGITFVEKNCKDKADALRRFSLVTTIPLSAIAFMGDDVNDLAALELSGFSAAPANAQPVVRQRASFVTKAVGGRGAVREFVEAVLAARAGKAAS
jgi:3-deoxy-D-manno-octulosonate 8-phosphate phosphatase (KDO 8-P phosphatase)